MKELIRFLAIVSVCLLLAYSAAAQTPEPTPGQICISRAAAETCATNASKVDSQAAYIATLEQSLKDKDKLITDLKVEVALKTGQIIGCQQDKADQREIIKAMIPMLRPKKIGINLF